MQTNSYTSTVSASQKQVEDLVLELLPAQGQWSEESYLWLTDHTTRLLEFTDGYIEVLPMPTDEHQTILLLLYERLTTFLRPRGGKVLVAPLRLKIPTNPTSLGSIRSPASCARHPARFSPLLQTMEFMIPAPAPLI